MSIKIMSLVWECSTRKRGELLLLLAMADHANDEGYCKPGMTSLARKTRASRRNVLYTIDKLIESGELEKIGTGTSDYGTNEYRIVLSGLVKPASLVKRTSRGGVKPTSRDLVKPASHESSLEPSIETSSNGNFKTRDIQDAYKSCVTYPIDWSHGESGAAKWLAENGYTPDDVKKCYAAVKFEGFWKDKNLTLVSLKKQIGPWKSKNGNGAKKVIKV